MRLLVLVACSLYVACASAAAADPRGIWLVEDKSAQIQLENCNGLLWGMVIWERMPGHDDENPDPALRGRPTLGIPIVQGVGFAGVRDLISFLKHDTSKSNPLLLGEKSSINRARRTITRAASSRLSTPATQAAATSPTLWPTIAAG